MFKRVHFDIVNNNPLCVKLKPISFDCTAKVTTSKNSFLFLLDIIFFILNLDISQILKNYSK